MDDSFHDGQWRRSFRRKLLAWYRREGRDLPWRRTRDPYAIWISEIMLQQTQVETVKPYYARFLRSFPDVQALAQASESDVLRHWEGLGYYRRAQQLHAAAQTIVQSHQGVLPTTFHEVHALPGIGRYTAGAILSFSQDQRLPIVEANTLRLYARLMAMREDPRRAAGQKQLWHFAESILPRSRPGELNQALMELGSQICRPSDPPCTQCPLANHCAAWREGCVDQVPRPPDKTKYEKVTEAAVVIRRNRRVLIRQCQPGERWAGLWDFPRCPVKQQNEAARRTEIQDAIHQQTGEPVALGSLLARMQHAVTRYRITLECYEAERVHGGNRNAAKKKPSPIQRWVYPSQLDGFPLSVTGRKLSQRLNR